MDGVEARRLASSLTRALVLDDIRPSSGILRQVAPGTLRSVEELLSSWEDGRGSFRVGPSAPRGSGSAVVLCWVRASEAEVGAVAGGTGDPCGCCVTSMAVTPPSDGARATVCV